MGDDNEKDSKEEKSSSGLGHFLIRVLVIVIILFFIFGLFSSLYATESSSGFFQSKLFVPLKTVFSPIGDGFSYIGKSLKSNLWDPITGQNAGFFSLEEQTVEKKKTGFELGDIVITRGITYNNVYTGDDIEATAVVKVNEFPEEMENIRVGFVCSLDDIQGQVLVNGDSIFHPEAQRNFIDATNPKKGGSEQYNVDCLISKDKIPTDFLPQIYNKKTIRFDLDYLRDNENAERVFLTVFIIPDEKLYNKYKGAPNNAFKDLMDGVYDNYRNIIPSSMQYESDVSAKMNFYRQPLGLNNKYELSFQFTNNIFGKGNVTVRGFRINLPNGFRFDSCKFLDRNELKEEYFEEINDELNNGRGESMKYDCDVFVEPSDYGKGELIILEKEDGITADFGFAETISKIRDISITKKAVK